MFNESAMLHDIPSTNDLVESKQKSNVQVEHIIDSDATSKAEIEGQMKQPLLRILQQLCNHRNNLLQQTELEGIQNQ